MLIDSNSLLFLAKDLLLLDNNNNLFEFIEKKFEEEKELILLNSVYEETKLINQGIIIKKLPFFKKIKKESNLNLDKKDHNYLNNNFVIDEQKKN